MNCKAKAEWARLLCRTEACLNAGLVPHLTDAERRSLAAHKPIIQEWVHTNSILEMRPSAHHDWVGVGEVAVGFHPSREYRIQPKEEDSVEQYSKEFWQQCLKMHTMHLSGAISGAISYHFKHIEAWVGGGKLEYNDPVKGWVAVPDEHHRFLAKWEYREAPIKPVGRDVVVYWRDAIEHPLLPQNAGIDVRILWPEGTHPKATTLASLKDKTPGFKLLSITRVVVDENHNLLEYSTKLDNLGRVPF